MYPIESKCSSIREPAFGGLKLELTILCVGRIHHSGDCRGDKYTTAASTTTASKRCGTIWVALQVFLNS